jgi:hypothetical protein
MQHCISNNDMMNDGRQRRPVLDHITSLFLRKAFKVLRDKDAIVITGSCVVALTLQKQERPSFRPGDIDVFVKQNFQLDNQIFDRCFLDRHILIPLLLEEGIHSEPKDILVKPGPSCDFKKYNSCMINILQIMEFSLFEEWEEVAVSRPKIQIIVVEDDSPIPLELPPPFYLTPFERKVVTSFDIDIVQGAYNPNSELVTFALSDTEWNIFQRKFWYICDSRRSFSLSSMMERITKYTDRGFIWEGFKDFIDPHRAISVTKYRLLKPRSFEIDTDSNREETKNSLH